MKMRTVTQFWQELKESDPHCAVGLGHLRAAVADGTIPTFTIGRRRVLDADTALAYLFAASSPDHKNGEVRRVE